MISNPVIQTLMEHRSIRKYKDTMPDDEIIKTVVRAGQQAPFAYQVYSVLLSRDIERNVFNAPLLFTICVDVHKFELVMKKRGWERATNDLTAMLFGVEDASYMAQNMVIAGRSLGLGSCFIGAPLGNPEPFVKKHRLPKCVYPIVQLAMGYPDEEPPARPRYPLDFVLFEGAYPDFDDATIEKAMEEMDSGYLEQDYYKNVNYMVPLGDKKDETYTFEDYVWTEHISRKLGLWADDLEEQREQIRKCGFKI